MAGQGPVLVLHDAVAAGAAPDRLDTLAQVNAVSKALTGLGHEVQPLAFELDLAALRGQVERLRLAVVFNLVEAAAGEARLHYLAAVLLETLRVPFTGCGSRALYCTGDKLIAKHLMRDLGIPTPAWLEWPGDVRRSPLPPGPWIVKPVAEDASVGVDAESVVEESGLAAARLRSLAARGGAWFAEHFIDGREFNLSVVGREREPRVLAPAEIEFVDFPAGQPRIVDYAAKWDSDSFAYRNTRRRFDFPAADHALLEQLSRLAEQCWHGFGLRGYARIDLRVDAQGRPWVLEVNANPCLAPDAGLAAAAARAGIDYPRLIAGLLPAGPGALAA